MMLVFLAMYGVMFLMTQYFQLVLGFSRARHRGPAPPDRADHVDRHAVHTADRAPLRRATGRWPWAWLIAARLRAVHPPGRRHALLVRVAGVDPAHDRHVDVDVADDRVHHVRGAREPCRRGLGDERRDPRARCRARHRRARQHRRVAVLQPPPRRGRPDPRLRACGGELVDGRRAARRRAVADRGLRRARERRAAPRSSTASTSRRSSVSCSHSWRRSSPGGSCPTPSRPSARCTPRSMRWRTRPSSVSAAPCRCSPTIHTLREHPGATRASRTLLAVTTSAEPGPASS